MKFARSVQLCVSGMDPISDLVQDSISASGRGLQKHNLLNLQSKMKSDPEGYGSELSFIYNQFKSSLELFERQAALNFTSLSGIANDPTVAKDLGERCMFLAHVTQFYPKQLSGFPNELALFLKASARSLPSGLRVKVTQALVLLINRKMIEVADIIVLFMELQTIGDRALKKLVFSHFIQSIRHMNHKHKNDTKNRALQNILYRMLQQEEETQAKVALVTLCDLHRRKVWFDDRTAIAICMACFHASSRIMKAALSFLLDFENIEVGDDSDGSGSEDDATTQQAQILLNKEAVYKASHKGTTSSKKKKKAKLLRVARSMKKKQRLSSENNSTNYYSPLNNLKDAQGFVEKLLSRLQKCNERFEVKMMMLMVIARTIGLHQLILLNFYPYLQKYVQPYQLHIPSLLCAVIHACHDMVPPDVVEPLFKQIVNQFVHDRSRSEAIISGLNVVREICMRMPLLMTKDLLQDLVLYIKSPEEQVSSAARALLSLFRVLYPSLLKKKDRGRPTDPKARCKAFGEVNVTSVIPDIELLDQGDDGDECVDEERNITTINEDNENDRDLGLTERDGSGGSESNCKNESDLSGDYDFEGDKNTENGEDDRNTTGEADDVRDEENEDADFVLETSSRLPETDISTNGVCASGSKTQKRKFSVIEEQVDATDRSLQALKKLVGVKSRNVPSYKNDGILSDENFQRIKDLKAKKEAQMALTQHGFKLPSSDQLSRRELMLLNFKLI